MMFKLVMTVIRYEAIYVKLIIVLGLILMFISIYQGNIDAAIMYFCTVGLYVIVTVQQVIIDMLANALFNEEDEEKQL